MQRAIVLQVRAIPAMTMVFATAPSGLIAETVSAPRAEAMAGAGWEIGQGGKPIEAGGRVTLGEGWENFRGGRRWCRRFP
jgi:hypothetical protein